MKAKQIVPADDSDSIFSRTFSVQTVARLLKLSPRRVQQLTKESVIPKASRGAYELAPAVHGYIGFLQELRPPETQDGEDNYESQRTRLYRARADEAEERVRLMKGQSHDAEAAAFFMGKAVAATRARILALPNALASTLSDLSDPEKCREILDAACRECAEELSDYDPKEVSGKTREYLLTDAEGEAQEAIPSE